MIAEELCTYTFECCDLEVVGHDWSSEVVSLLLEDLVARVPLSCEMALDLHVPRMEWKKHSKKTHCHSETEHSFTL